MNAKEIFKVARRLYRRGLNETHRTPILYDQLYTRSGRNGSFNPEGFNADLAASRIHLTRLRLDPKKLQRAQSLLHRYNEPPRIISKIRENYLHETRQRYEYVNGEKVWYDADQATKANAVNRVRLELRLLKVR